MDQDTFEFDFSQTENDFDSKLYGYEESLIRLADPNVSLARFGDGELKLMFNEYFHLGFQRNSAELRDALLAVADEKADDLYLGFNPTFRNQRYSEMYMRIYPDVKRVFGPTERFINACVSRPPCFSELKGSAVDLWRDVWADKRILIVAGSGSRFQYYPELFDSAKGVEMMDAPAVGAFEFLDSIQKEMLTQYKFDRVLIALGPAATVLAHRLWASGVSALDVGHLTASYAHIMLKATYPEKLPMSKDDGQE